MTHYRQQRSVLSSGDTVPRVSDCRQYPEYLSSRLTPSPEPSPPALRLGQDTSANESGTPFASNLADLYRSTDVAKPVGPDESLQAKSSDDGLEGSDEESGRLPAYFEESTSHVVTITCFSDKEYCRAGTHEDEDLIVACSETEEQDNSESGSLAVVLRTNGCSSAARTSPEQPPHLAVVEFLDSDATLASSTALPQSRGAATANEEEVLGGTDNASGALGTRSTAVGVNSTPPGEEAEYKVKDAADEGAERGDSRSPTREGAVHRRAVAAVRRRSLLAGGAAAVGVGLCAVTCVSPWNIELAGFCIVAGVCLCILGWFGANSESRLLLSLHSVFLLLFLITLALSIALNVHWAVQSFRALRHAYFDETVSQQGKSYAGPQNLRLSIPSAFPDRDTASPSSAQNTLAGATTAAGVVHDDNTVGRRSEKYTDVSSVLSTSDDGSNVTTKQKAPPDSRVHQPEHHFATAFQLPSDVPQTTVPTSQRPHLSTASFLAKHQLREVQEESFGSSHNRLEASYSVRRRSLEEKDGLTRTRLEADEIPREASLVGFGASQENSLLASPHTNQQTTETPVLSRFVADNTEEAANLLERSRGPGDSDGSASLPCDSWTITSLRGVSALFNSADLASGAILTAEFKQRESTPPADREGLKDDGRYLSPSEERPDALRRSPTREERVHSERTRDALCARLDSKQQQTFMNTAYLTPQGHGGDPADLQRAGAPFEGSKIDVSDSQEASLRRTSLANVSGSQSTRSSSAGAHASGSKTFFNDVSWSTYAKALRTVGRRISSQVQVGVIDAPRQVPGAPTAGESEETSGQNHDSEWGLQENIVNPEPARCADVPSALLKYVHSTRRQLETYGLLCAFTRYDLWGLFSRWTIDCENACGFKLLATKRYMWSTGLNEDAAGGAPSAARASDVPRLQNFSRSTARSSPSVTPSSEQLLDELLPTPSVTPGFPTKANSATGSYPTTEYLRWQASLPPEQQKKCLEGALDVACSVVKSHYLMVLPPLAVILLLICLIVLGIGVAALRSTYRLARLAAKRKSSASLVE